jgi:heme O synthase-like polyprenyltransferase
MKISIPIRSYIQTAVVWASVGSIGGIGVGLVLVALHGFSIISLSFWFSVGILTGAVAGFLSFIFYAIGYRILKRKEPPNLFPDIKKG